MELLQPFYDQASGLWVLLNRGWLPWPDRRTPVQFDTPDGVLQLNAWTFLIVINVFLLIFGIFIEPLPGVMVLVQARWGWQAPFALMGLGLVIGCLPFAFPEMQIRLIDSGLANTSCARDSALSRSSITRSAFLK